ncbi:MAG: CDP-alcohol phosphatidyltransferase family protein [Chitinophagaceae bacterium]|nr:MAG: CDP-alcohol phosphatidyltransferase family protein [Chitinophagaceae bacterium]
MQIKNGSRSSTSVHRTSFFVVNAITLYRLLSSFALLYFIITSQLSVFKWLLPVSFLTDTVDGFLARKYKVTSAAGSRIDSIADDLTVFMAIVGIFVFQRDFIQQEKLVVLILAGFYLLQLTLAFLKYGKPTSFHTYLAKCAAVLQAVFLVLFFHLSHTPPFIFYLAASVTLLDLLEESILVILLPKWTADVKGLYWALK